jgi:hypothetical protein
VRFPGNEPTSPVACKRRREERENKSWSFNKPQRISKGFIDPTLDRSKIGISKQAKGIRFRKLNNRSLMNADMMRTRQSDLKRLFYFDRFVLVENINFSIGARYRVIDLRFEEGFVTAC